MWRSLAIQFSDGSIESSSKSTTVRIDYCELITCTKPPGAAAGAGEGGEGGAAEGEEEAAGRGGGKGGGGQAGGGGQGEAAGMAGEPAA